MKTILVTGANRGLGLEFVKQYSEANWLVFACCRNPAKAHELNSICSTKSNVKIYPLDVTNNVDINNLSVELEHESIDILLHNAAIWGPRNISLDNNIDEDEWLSVIKTNAIAPLNLTKAFIQQVARSNRKLIAGISSEMGCVTDQRGGEYIYRSSKAAFNSILKNLASDLKKFNITVVALEPGWVKTEMGGLNAPLTPKESVENMCKLIDTFDLNDSGQLVFHDGKILAW